jgi:hypothetical protein
MPTVLRHFSKALIDLVCQTVEKWQSGGAIRPRRNVDGPNELVSDVGAVWEKPHSSTCHAQAEAGRQDRAGLGLLHQGTWPGLPG